MKGLLMKELFLLLPYRKSFLLMTGLGLAMGVFLGGGARFFCLMLVVYLIILSMSVHRADEAAGWDRYAVSLPVARSVIVGARYLFLALLLAVAMAVALAAGAVAALAAGAQHWLGEAAASCGGAGLLYLFVSSLSVPLVYRFGPEKARLALLLVFILPYLAVIWAMPYLAVLLAGAAPFAAPLGAGAALALYLLSWRVSSRIYAAKDF